jgi:NDP-sugar pyrophosphorylase family protein
MINEFINKNYKSNKIFLSHEKTLLDTAGGVKKALSFFKYDTALILNSDIFWKNENIDDLKNFINNYKSEQKCKLLLVPKEKAHGIHSDSGDFSIVNGFLERYKKNQNVLFYSGAQILSLDLLSSYKQQKFSFNLLWDDQIKKKLIFGDIMNSHWYHLGDMKSLKENGNLMS